jgi:hypothetical protein
MKTVEFLLWSNCPNNCRFCWQRLFHDKTTWLNEEEKLQSIKDCSEMIKEEGGPNDLLLVGGEVFNSHEKSVNDSLKSLYHQIVTYIKKDKVRFLYANTNLTYSDRTNLVNLLDAFEGLEDRLKFTTSYDLDGRFNRLNEAEMQALEAGKQCKPLNREELFLDNLKFIDENYPKINTVVNTIVTKAVYEAVSKDDDYDLFWLMKKYPNTVVWVNLIPYIPVKGYEGLDVRYSQTLKVLERANELMPGYLLSYTENFDENQDKELYEYHKDGGFVERTAGMLPCGHNENFKLVNRADECFICKLKEYCKDNFDRLSQ